MHTFISQIRSIEFSPCWWCKAGIELFKAWKMKTDALWWWGRWMNARFQLNSAWTWWNLQLPCECTKYYSCDLAWIMHDLASIQHNNACRWWLEQEASKSNQEIQWKKLKKFERIWEDLCFGFGSEIVIVLMQNSVRIRTLYFLLITLAKHD